MKQRINGIAYNLQTLTKHELDALIDMAEVRIGRAQQDLEKLGRELNRRDHELQRVLDI